MCERPHRVGPSSLGWGISTQMPGCPGTSRRTQPFWWRKTRLPPSDSFVSFQSHAAACALSALGHESTHGEDPGALWRAVRNSSCYEKRLPNSRAVLRGPSETLCLAPGRAPGCLHTGQVHGPAHWKGVGQPQSLHQGPGRGRCFPVPLQPWVLILNSLSQDS